ncbi:hypothetical protein TWF730_003095 [Orbilia blumenaviensis]|uniref:Uncharacterized protein n=1 Tax=Orbilia blumenaviensis TaxID=1796055 RepID=A0AAV9U8P3_9PEZI
MSRSVSCEVELEAGTWDIAYKITATKVDDRKSVEEAVPELSVNNRKKFLQAGMSYDLAFAKGRTIVVDPEEDSEESDDDESKDGNEESQKKEPKDPKGTTESKPPKVLVDKPLKPESTPEAPPAAPEPPTSDVTEPPGAKKDSPGTAQAQGDKSDKKSAGEPAKETEGKDKETPPEKDEEKPSGPVAYMLVPITAEEDSDSEDEENLWNAVAVVGLRVYSQQKDIGVQVIRPKGATKLLLDPDDKNQDVAKDEKDRAESGEKPADKKEDDEWEDVEDEASGETDESKEGKKDKDNVKEASPEPGAEGKKDATSQDQTEDAPESTRSEGSGTFVEAPAAEKVAEKEAVAAQEIPILSSDLDDVPPKENTKAEEPEKNVASSSVD